MNESADELTCQELVELVTDYLENALPAAVRARFEAHLAGCDGCITYVDQARLTIRLTGQLSEDSLSAPARDELLGVFRDWKQGPAAG
ncbi:MAG: zf-HC2 domain-containing protein [Caldilineaceae bacterium]|nr:zf-HC2 domain-containing protein [Caldilineaceae bacterium]